MAKFVAVCAIIVETKGDLPAEDLRVGVGALIDAMVRDMEYDIELDHATSATIAMHGCVQVMVLPYTDNISN